MAEIEKNDLVTNQKILEIVNDKIYHTIIETLLDSTRMSGMTIKEIAERNHLSQTDLIYYLNILVNVQFVMLKKFESENLYYIDEVAMIKKLFNYISLSQRLGVNSACDK